MFAQVKQKVVTNALCYQLPERNITVFKRLRNMVNDNELSEVKDVPYSSGVDCRKHFFAERIVQRWTAYG